MLTTTITFIVVLGFLIFIHEFGHFFAARKIGVKVLEFSIGFPPKLFSKVYGETKYIISWIPLGGYVRLLGQDTEDENPDEPGNYASKSILGRFFILVAGSFMNILTAFILMPLVFFIGYEVPAYLESSPIVGSIKQGSIAEKVGFKKDDLILSVNGENTLTWKEVQEKIQTNQNPLLKLQLLRDKDKLERQITFTELSRAGEMGWKEKIEPIIGKVILDSPADQAGIKKEDLILSINGEEIQDWSQISPLVKKYGEQQLKIKFSRKGKILETTLIPEFSQEGGYWVIGVFSSNKEVSEGFLDSIVLGSERVVFLGKMSFVFLYRLISGQESVKSVGGPIMIASMVGQAARNGVSSLLSLMAFISLQLGIFNLLPIPALDGGHIFFLILEKIKGSTLSKKFRINMQRSGFSILILLILYISVQDGLRIFN